MAAGLLLFGLAEQGVVVVVEPFAVALQSAVHPIEKGRRQPQQTPPRHALPARE